MFYGIVLLSLRLKNFFRNILSRLILLINLCQIDDLGLLRTCILFDNRCQFTPFLEIFSSTWIDLRELYLISVLINCDTSGSFCNVLFGVIVFTILFVNQKLIGPFALIWRYFFISIVFLLVLQAFCQDLLF